MSGSTQGQLFEVPDLILVPKVAPKAQKVNLLTNCGCVLGMFWAQLSNLFPFLGIPYNSFLGPLFLCVFWFGFWCQRRPQGILAGGATCASNMANNVRIQYLVVFLRTLSQVDLRSALDTLLASTFGCPPFGEIIEVDVGTKQRQP